MNSKLRNSKLRNSKFRNSKFRSFRFGRFRAYAALLMVGSWLAPFAAAQSEPVLTARPGVCIVTDPAAPQCQMALDLMWNSALRNTYCLYSSIHSAAMRCWAGAREGRHHFELASEESVRFWLQRPPAITPMAEITVRVVRLAQRNPERRRRRHVWSVP